MYCDALWIILVSCTLVYARPSHREFRRQYDKTEIKVDESEHDVQFFNFVSRPDIDAPRWNVKVYDEDALAPGYWFMTAYGAVEQTDNNKAYVGPYIYDGRGELVWSGASTFDNYGTFDFKVSKLNGEEVISTIYPEGGAVHILDKSYETEEILRLAKHDAQIPERKQVNIHDFQIVDDSFLVLDRKVKTFQQEVMDLMNYHGPCKVQMNGFQEANLATGEISFMWNPEHHISFNESYTNPARCQGDGWDYAHLNSLDKLPDGDYLVSARHVNTIFKISAKDGSIVWRLNGKQSDFEWIDDGHFLGQHDARFLSQNDTHLLISLMDNAIGPGRPRTNNDYSRGLVLALRIDRNPMTVQVVSHFDHPQNSYAMARGNVQLLPNGNAFIGWSDKALHSEHTPDGKVIFEAELPSGLKSYRSYKFPWVGHPKQPPDVHSAAITIEGTAITTVQVSWNGATEVSSWNLYKTNRKGDVTQLVASREREGFETALTYKGYASYVIIEAVDRHGEVLGSSDVAKTVEPYDLPPSDLATETQWLQDNSRPIDHMKWVSASSLFAFFFGATFSTVVLLSAWFFRKTWRNRSLPRQQLSQPYQPLLHDATWEEEEDDDSNQHNREVADLPYVKDQ